MKFTIKIKKPTEADADIETLVFDAATTDIAKMKAYDIVEDNASTIKVDNEYIAIVYNENNRSHQLEEIVGGIAMHFHLKNGNVIWTEPTLRHQGLVALAGIWSAKTNKNKFNGFNFDLSVVPLPNMSNGKRIVELCMTAYNDFKSFKVKRNAIESYSIVTSTIDDMRTELEVHVQSYLNTLF